MSLAPENSYVVPVWIDGKGEPSDPSRFLAVRSAKTCSTLHLAQGATPELAHKAASSASDAFPGWKSTTYIVRRDLILRVADIYERRIEKFVKYQCDETSCDEAWARFNVNLACKLLRETAASISSECTGELPPLETQDSFCLVQKEPIGPTLAICPWNASMILSTRALASPIAAGCTVVFKASELCPHTHFAIVEAFNEAGLPGGCLNSLQASREDGPAVTEALISHDAIRKVEFVGSAHVGSVIGQLAAKYLKPVLMELGGKGAALVLKDANLQKAATMCALGAFLHHGQICMSTDRIIVVQEVAAEFSEHLVREVKTKWDGSSGFAISKSVADHAQLLLTEAKANGAFCLVGDIEWRGKEGASLKPAIITNAKPNDRIYGEETFGPSASLFIVKDEEEAIKLANDTTYGLNAAVHTRDAFRGLRVAKRLEFGQVHINMITEYDEPTVPIGGMKSSGWGRNNGKYGLREFLVERTISFHDSDAQVAFG